LREFAELIRHNGRPLQPDTLAHWSSQRSVIHDLDERVKLVVLLAFALSVALQRDIRPLQVGVLVAALVAFALAAKLPLRRLVLRTLFVVPVVGPFAAILYVTGDHHRAVTILIKTYLSTLAVLIMVATTPFSRLLAAGRWLRLPVMLVEVTQLIYRYLFLLMAQAQQMRIAFRARGGAVGKRAFVGSAGIIAILFERSYERAVFTQQAMLARGFNGVLPTFAHRRVNAADILFLVLGLTVSAGIHMLNR
jgi:cobalt/nickel transport system permease protein